MKYLKKFESGSWNGNDRSNYWSKMEIWEVDNKGVITGFSTWVEASDLQEFVDKGLIFYDKIDKDDEPLSLEDNREKLEELIELKNTANKYNL